IPVGPPRYEVVAVADGSSSSFQLDADQARGILEAALRRAREVGLPWREEEIVLHPSDRLVDLVRRSIRIRVGGADES
ncbi:MAG TPA: hypothetical protein VKW77_00380, partial [Acidimicrobiales bacterium]|nr:hypothetical protein [Acidimicrobiales bacterium]